MLITKEIQSITRNHFKNKTLHQDNTKLTQILPGVEKEEVFHSLLHEVNITLIFKTKQEYYKIGKL